MRLSVNPSLHRVLIAALLHVLTTACPVFGAEDELSQARHLLESGQAVKAYELLAPLQPARAGDPDFDYTLGISALQAERPTEAVFALERAAALRPGDSRIRMSLGMAYFNLNEWQSARQEFEVVKRQDPSPASKATADRYLEAIAWIVSNAYSPFWLKDADRYYDELARAQMASTRRSKLWGFAEIFAGYDSNINSATRNTSLAIPAYDNAVVALDPDGTEINSGIGGVAAGIAFEHALSPNLSLIGGAGGRDKETGNRFNTTTVDGYGGLQWLLGRNTLTLSAQAEHFMVDKHAFREAFGGIAQWTYLLDENSRMTLYLQGLKLEYPHQDVLDAYRLVGGLSLTESLAWPWPSLLFGGIYGGSQPQDQQNMPHLGYDLCGIRLGMSVSIREDMSIFTSASAEFRRYGGAEPLFLRTREDNQGEVAIGVDYMPAQHWRLTPRVQYIVNSSNIELFDYDRTEVTLTLRRDF